MKDIIEELGLEGAKPADTPMIVSQSSKKDSDSRALSMRDATLYRRLVAKLNYLAMERPDIRHAASVMGSQASSPKESGAISDWATNHLEKRGAATKSPKGRKPAWKGRWENAISGEQMDNVRKETHVVSVMN